jgi:hypothetical protein
MNPDFSLRFSDGRYCVYRRRRERFTNQSLYEFDCILGGSVMVWAGICHDGRTQLKIVQGTLNAVKFRDDILDPIVLPFLQQRHFDYVFQHDNARCHVARVCQDFLHQNHIRVLLWPALSPDLSPIEHLRDKLGRRVRHVKIHRKHYRSCVTHLCMSGTTSHKPLSNDWMVLYVGDAKLSLLQEVVTQVTELRKPPYCMTISVCPWFVLW